MNEMFLLKLGEIVLKGLNRFTFENRLKSNLARRLRPYGKFRVYIIQSTLYVEPEAPDCDLDGAWEACGAVFGVVSMSRCRPCEKNLDAVFQAVMDYLGDDLAAAKSFKVESKRSDKSFPMTSIQISQEIGGRLAEAFPNLEVDVHHPEYTVYVELRDRSGYVHGPAQRGAGGLPTGVGGRAAVLLSGGIDSPVAAYMMAKRGLELECVHFFSYPYTSEQAKEKVLELARLVSRYCGRMTVQVVPLHRNAGGHPRPVPRGALHADHAPLHDAHCRADCPRPTAAAASSPARVSARWPARPWRPWLSPARSATLPVFRPVIGMDKEEIIAIARRIDTMETSILPYEDCCTVFTPKHPRTRPTMAQIEAAEAALDVEGLVQRAVENTTRVHVSFKE